LTTGHWNCSSQQIFADNIILDDFIPNIRLVDNDSETSQKRISDAFIPSACVNRHDMIQLLHRCLVINLKSRVIYIFDKLKLLAIEKREPAEAFDGFSLRFAKGLTDIPIGETPLAQVFHEVVTYFMEYILDTYVSRCVGPKPASPKDWQREQCGCGCTDCLQLDAFLVDPVQKETRIFAEAQDRVQHLKDQVSRISQGWYRGAQPGHQTEIMSSGSGFELMIQKTERAWSSATEVWKENKTAAENSTWQRKKDQPTCKGKIRCHQDAHTSR
jgi:hypothetical protein